MKQKTIIFDFDGTIADTLPFLIKIVNDNADKYGFNKFTDKEIEHSRNMNAKDIIKQLKIPFYKLPFFVIEIQKLLSKKMSEVKGFSGVKKFLVNLKEKNYTLGLLSSNSKENIDVFLKNNDLEVFDFIHSERNIFGKDKPLINLIKRYKLNKNEIIYIGDEVRDIEACRKVGVKIISVGWGFNKPEILKKNNKFVALNIKELENYIKHLYSA